MKLPITITRYRDLQGHYPDCILLLHWPNNNPPVERLRGVKEKYFQYTSIGNGNGMVIDLQSGVTMTPERLFEDYRGVFVIVDYYSEKYESSLQLLKYLNYHMQRQGRGKWASIANATPKFLRDELEGFSGSSDMYTMPGWWKNKYEKFFK